MRLLILILLLPFISEAQIIRANSYYTAHATASGGFSPKDISGCKLWVYADTLGLSNNDPVSTWTDLSGNGNNATQSGTLRPLYKTGVQNSRAVLRFDGSDDFLDISNTSIIGGETGMTAFMVVKQASLATNQAILAKWDYATDGTFAIQTSDVSNNELTEYIANGCTDAGGNHQNSTNGSLTTAFYIIEFVYDGTQSTNADRVKIYVNGTLTSMTVVGTLATSLTSCSATLKIGKFGGALSRVYNGDMGEIVLYNSALNSTDRTSIRNYLNAHWAIY